MKTITINVTEEDIKNGIPGSPYSCPIARAVTRALPNPDLVYVNRTDLRAFWDRKRRWFFFHQPSKTIIRPLTKRQKAFVINFDAGFEVEPFSFEVELW